MDSEGEREILRKGNIMKEIDKLKGSGLIVLGNGRKIDINYDLTVYQKVFYDGELEIKGRFDLLCFLQPVDFDLYYELRNIGTFNVRIDDNREFKAFLGDPISPDTIEIKLADGMDFFKPYN